MSIQKYYEVICDVCNSAIGHYVVSIQDSLEQAEADGAIVGRRKQFCGEECFNKYKKESCLKK